MTLFTEGRLQAFERMMDDRGNDDPDRERTTEKPSVLAELRDRAGRIPPMTHRDDEEVAL